MSKEKSQNSYQVIIEHVYDKYRMCYKYDEIPEILRKLVFNIQSSSNENNESEK